MRFRTLFAGAAVAALAVTSAAPAFADTAPPPGTATIDQVTPIVVDPQHPYVAHASFRYICVSTVAAPHLFVAAKQGPFINTGTRSSSDWARAFYSTNWRSDKAPNALTCDGTAHRALLTLLPDAGFTAHHGLQALQTGKQAFLQICVFDDSGLSMNYSMKGVMAG